MSKLKIVIDVEKIQQVLADTTGHVIMHGPRGAGKSYRAMRAGRPGQPVFNLTLRDNQTAGEVLGHWVQATSGGFEFYKGPLLQAWETGGLLVLNEIHRASEEVMDLLVVALDDPDVAAYTTPIGTFRPGAGFRTIGTLNGDPKNEIDERLLDRFELTCPVYTPSEAQLAILSPAVRQVVTNLYNTSAAKGGLEPLVTYRQFRNFDKLRGIIGDEMAAMSMTHSNEQLAHTILEMIQIAEAQLMPGVAT